MLISILFASAFLLKDAVVAVEDAMVPPFDYEGSRTSAEYRALVEASKKKGDGFDAACDMTNALSKVVGRAVPLCRESQVPKDAKAVIYLGDTKAAKAAGLDVASLKSWEYLIRAEKGRAFVAARTGFGTSYGVTDALERFADYYLMTVNGNDPYVRDPDRAVEPCDVRSHAAICRASHYNGGPGPSRARLNRYSRKLGTSPNESEMEGEVRVSPMAWGCHSVFCYVPHARYFESMPELFNLIGGKFEGSQLCYANPMTWRIAFDSLKGFVTEQRRRAPTDMPRTFDFSQRDCTRYLCRCRKCEEIGRKYLREEGVKSGDGLWRGGDAGVQLEFVNRLAREIAKVDPDAVIRTFAYNSTAVPPKDGTIVPEPNVCIRYVDPYCYTDHMLPHVHPFNDEFHRHAQTWRKIAKRMSVWDYMLYDDVCPEASVDAIKADVTLWRSMGIDELFMEHDYAFQPFYELNAFLFGQCCRDPDADVERLVGVFCRSYGKGAPKMREAIGYLRKIILEHPPWDAGQWVARIIPWRSSEHIGRLRELMLAAYGQADDPVSKARIAHPLSVTCREYARTLLCDPKANELLGTYLDEHVKYWEEYMDCPAACAVVPKDAAEARGRARSNREAMLPPRFKDLPPEAAKLPLERLVFRDYRTGPAGPGVLFDDPDSEIGKALLYAQEIATNGVSMSFGLEPWWFTTRVSGSFRTPPLKADGKYRWYKVGVARFVNAGAFNMPPHLGTWPMQNYYRYEAPGTKEDLNRYEIWVSLKLIENDYVVKMAKRQADERKSPGLDLEDETVDDLEEAPVPIKDRKFGKGKTPGVYLDRLLLVRQDGVIPEKK